MKHTIEYEYDHIATVEIDETKAADLIKDMVNFWSGAEDRLEENDGNYTNAWLKMLGMFILNNRRPPDGDEGWCKLDGKFGIKILSWNRWEFDEEQIDLIHT